MELWILIGPVVAIAVFATAFAGWLDRKDHQQRWRKGKRP